MTVSACPFCTVDLSRIAFVDELVVGIWDGFAVSPGHLLIVPRRHAATWDDTTTEERQAIWASIDRAKALISQNHKPDGYNVGFNQNVAGGQTVFHFHLHVIPRYSGDVSDPRGGVRHVIPNKANYLASLPKGEPQGQRLVTGGTDHLLPHLIRHLDQATHCDIAVAFLLESGAKLIIEHLKDFLARGGQARILVGDYLEVTDPAALRRLLDLDGDLTFRVYEARVHGFHLKAYIFQSDNDGVGFIGSSNLSQAALTDSIEWNYKVISSFDQTAFPEIRNSFDHLFNAYESVTVTPDWIDRYESRRTITGFQDAGLPFEFPDASPEPHAVQKQALAALELTRQDGFTAGLVVLATGLGKTWLAAFDSNKPEFRRVLFVAHREEILNQAIETFRRVHPKAKIGRMTGQEKDGHADLLFASVQTIGRAAHIRKFKPDDFDYIVIDEFHHAAAGTYRRIIDHFEPRFLLGLTATPERSDGADLLALCQENLVFQAGIPLGIEGGHLCPFHYFGVPDEVDYRNIPWRNSQFDITELTAAVATESRARNAMEQYRKRGGKKCIGFCCSQTHADFMANFFNTHGIKSVAVHSGEGSSPRASSLQALAAGDIEVVFAVDMFNEGVDVPSIDTVLMLRPTESTIIWLQQLGRGLRTSPGKDHLNVIDYIGNHRAFLAKLRALASVAEHENSSNGHIRAFLEKIRGDLISLPTGCEITYDLTSIDILDQLLKPTLTEDALGGFYHTFTERHGVRPTATEVFHAGLNPRHNSERSWLGFVNRVKGFDDGERMLWGEHQDFFSDIEMTALTKSYKLIVLLAMFDEGLFENSISIDVVTERVSRLALRMHKVEQDFSVDLRDLSAVKALLIKYPLDALAGGVTPDAKAFFRVEGGRITLNFEPKDRTIFSELLRELLDWRLAQYLDRSGAQIEQRDIICRVSRNTSGNPILFLPTSQGQRPLPKGELHVAVDGKLFTATISEIAINVVRDSEASHNRLPEILRGWFGSEAGLPGKGERVRLQARHDGWIMEPMSATSTQHSGLRLWERYARDLIPPAFGLAFNQAIWNVGFVVSQPHMFLLVTLEKGDLVGEHQYADYFASSTEFHWQSQNRTTQASKAGQMIRDHRVLGIQVHLLVRKTKKVGSKPVPFTYCGEVEFVSWSGNSPISVVWQLKEKMPQAVYSIFKS